MKLTPQEIDDIIYEGERGDFPKDNTRLTIVLMSVAVWLGIGVAVAVWLS